jgi:hypothetical protein
MSYNLAFAVVRDTTLDEIGILDSTSLSFDEVTSPGIMALTGAQVGPHVLAVDPLFGDLTKGIAPRLGRQVYIVTLSGVADVYALQAFGPVERLLVHTSHEVTENDGEPLAVEGVLDGADDLEDAHLFVLSALLQAPFDALTSADFVTLDEGDAAELLDFAP